MSGELDATADEDSENEMSSFLIRSSNLIPVSHNRRMNREK